MKHLIYYFTGTGNSLYTAKLLSEHLEDSEIVSILHPEQKITEKTETVGIVFPVYMHRPPHFIADFLIKLPKINYLYAVAANGGDIGQPFTYIKKILPADHENLKAGFNILTPSNYLPFGEAAGGEARDKMLSNIDVRVQEISRLILEKTVHFDKEVPFFYKYIIPGFFYEMGYKLIPRLDRSFSFDNSCNSCGICEKVCPSGNVKLENGRPIWHHNCQMCFACINLCPESAIQYGSMTRGLKRYKNPEVTVKEIMNQKSGS